MVWPAIPEARAAWSQYKLAISFKVRLSTFKTRLPCAIVLNGCGRRAAFQVDACLQLQPIRLKRAQTNDCRLPPGVVWASAACASSWNPSPNTAASASAS